MLQLMDFFSWLPSHRGKFERMSTNFSFSFGKTFTLQFDFRATEEKLCCFRCFLSLVTALAVIVISFSAQSRGFSVPQKFCSETKVAISL